jgi:dolichol-phosphate mannosyltransferase
MDIKNMRCLMKKLYSLVIPLYNEEQVIHECIKRVTHVMKDKKFDYEVIFVNDGSRDSTESIVKEYCRNDIHLKLISFSRNFGHQTAITAGMDNAAGDAVIVMDADLQDPPEVVLQMIEKHEEGMMSYMQYGQREKARLSSRKLPRKYFTDFKEHV